MATLKANNVNQWPVTVGALGLYTAGGLFWAFLPHFIGLQAESGNLSQTQAGSLGSGYLIGFTLASVSALWWVARFNWRLVVIGAALIVIGALSVLQGVTFYWLSMLSVSIIGVMMGSFWSIAYRIFAGSANPDRSFAVGIWVSYTALAAISYIIGQFVIPAAGLGGAAYVLGAIIAMLAFSTLLIPAKSPTVDTSTVIAYRPSMPVALALIGILTTGLAFAAVWAFTQRIGVQAGFNHTDISFVIASNLLASAAGSMLATVVGARLGRRRSLFFGLVVMAVAIVALSGAATFWLYAAAIVALGLGVGFVMPYQMATLAVLDNSGRFVVLIGAAQGLGSAAGPFLGGLMADSAGLQALIIMAVLMLLISAAAFSLIGLSED